MTERTLEFYLKEDGPYQQTVRHVVTPYVAELTASPELFGVINQDLQNLSSQLYLDFDKYDKRIKSCFLASYLVLKQYDATLPDTTEALPEKQVVKNLLKLFENDIQLDKKELISRMQDIVDEVRTGLDSWINLDILNGDYEAAQRVLVTTYVSLRTLWLKLSKDRIVRLFVSSDIKLSLLSSQRLLHKVYGDWIDKKEAREARCYEDEIRREANSSFNEQVSLVVGRLQHQLNKEKDKATLAYKGRAKLAETLLPIADMICNFRTVDQFITDLSSSYSEHSSQLRLYHTLSLSEGEHKQLENFFTPKSSFFGFMTSFSLDQNHQIFSLLKRALERSMKIHFSDHSFSTYITFHDLRNYLRSFNDEDFLQEHLTHISDRMNAVVFVKELLLLQVANLPLLKIQERDPAFFECMEDESEVTEAIISEVSTVQGELLAAQNEVNEKQSLFNDWRQGWHNYYCLKDSLSAYEQEALVDIEERTIGDLYENLVPDNTETELSAKLAACGKAYESVGQSIDSELGTVTGLIDSLNHSTAAQALELLKGYVEARKTRWWHKLLYRVSPTYQACFQAIKVGVVEHDGNHQDDPFTVLNQIRDSIYESVAHCSWSMIKKISLTPFVKTLNQLLFFQVEVSETKSQDRADDLTTLGV